MTSSVCGCAGQATKKERQSSATEIPVYQEVYSEPRQTFKMEQFSKIVNGWTFFFGGILNIFILVSGVCIVGRGVFCLEDHGILKENLKLHNPSIKSIFRITNLIYFRDIKKIRLIRSEKISFSISIYRECLKHFVLFPVDHFLSNFYLMFPSITIRWNFRVRSFFSSILGIETLHFFEKV